MDEEQLPKDLADLRAARARMYAAEPSTAPFHSAVADQDRITRHVHHGAPDGPEAREADLIREAAVAEERRAVLREPVGPGLDLLDDI